MTAVLWLLVAVPAVVGGLLLVAGRSADAVAARVGVLAAVVLADLVLVAAFARPSVEVAWLPRLPVGLGLDDLSAPLALVVAGVLVLVLLSAAAQQVQSPARFSGLMLVFAASVLLTLTATTLAPLLVGWEVMGATSYALIAHRYRDPAAPPAGLSAFVTTRAADLGLYVAVGAALAGGVGTSLDDLAGLQGGWLHLAAAGVAAAGLAKAAQLPVSSWLSGAMHAPSQVSALLHSAAMVAMGGYLLLRLAPLLAASGWADAAVAWTGALTALVLGLVALAQTDLKQLLAASTAAQLGFVVAAAGVGGAAVGRDELVAHAVVKAALFLLAGVLLHAYGTKRLRSLAGRARGLLAAVAAVAGLALAGLPPLSLWAAKENLLEEVHAVSLPLYLVLLAASGLSAAYAGRVVLVLVREEQAPDAWLDDAEEGTRTVTALDRLPLLVLAVAAVAVTVVALPLRTGATGVALSLLVLVAGLGYAWVRPLPPRLPTGAGAVLHDWLHLHRALLAVAVRPVLDLARLVATADDRLLVPAAAGVASLARRAGAAVATVDDRVLAPAVTGTATASRVAATGVAVADRLGPDAAVRGVAAGTRRLGRLSLVPQNGQLHTYYAQAVVALGVLGLVLWIGR